MNHLLFLIDMNSLHHVKGKSSQVPLFLLEENMEPILCTQPRRFAVVTIARMVAKARNCEVGGEVGYHIGHSNITNITSARYFIISLGNYASVTSPYFLYSDILDFLMLLTEEYCCIFKIVHHLSFW